MSVTGDKLDSLIELFNDLFGSTENTILKSGAEEPFYQAAKAHAPAIIYSREDYYSSALHEIAHWCIAGKARREIDDFGYWYRPEGRSEAEQVEFERVEIKPQAIEWALSLACEHPFHFSADNISQGIEASDEFKMNVKAQLKEYLEKATLPPRAQLLFERLNQVFRNNQKLDFIDV